MPGPAPTSLGLVAAGSLYSPYGSGPIAPPLDMVTTVDIPASSYAHPLPIVILATFAPVGHFGAIYGPFDTFGPPADDAPGPGAANVYQPFNFDGSGGYAYDFGRPTFEVPPAFDLAESECPTGDGGSVALGYYCFPTRPIPAGSTISLPFTLVAGGDVHPSWLGAAVMAFPDGNTPSVFFGGRCLEPLNTDDGNFGNVPLGDHTFDELFGGFEQLVAIVWSSGHVIGGGPPGFTFCEPDPGFTGVDSSQTMVDTSGRWTKLHSDGADTVDYFGGLTYSVFTLDTSAVDLTQPMVTFENDALGDNTGGFPSGTPPDLYAGFIMYRMQYAARPGFPGLNRVIPTASARRPASRSAPLRLPAFERRSSGLLAPRSPCSRPPELRRRRRLSSAATAAMIAPTAVNSRREH